MVFNKKIGALIILFLINIIGIIALQFVVDTNIWLDAYFILLFFLLLITWSLIYQLFKKNYQDIILPWMLLTNFIFYALIGVTIRSWGIGDTLFFIMWAILKFVIAVFVIFAFLSPLEPCLKKVTKFNTKWIKIDDKKWFRSISIIVMVFLIFNQTLFVFPLAIMPVRNLKVDQNYDEIQKIVDEITENKNTNLEKTKAIFEWFNSTNYNIFNTWRPLGLKSSFINDNWISIRATLPYFFKVSYRTLDNSNPLWILTTRTGNCGEYAKLFTEMAHRAGLEARTIRPKEMDHVWNEVLIDGEYIVVDPSRFWFNPDPYRYENETGNFSYVYALGPWDGEQDKIDVTSNYTDTATVNITTVDLENNIVPNVDVTVYSNNKNGGKTELSFKTNESGKYQVKIGGGTVTFKSSNGSHVNSTKKTFYENEFYDISIQMESRKPEETDMVEGILFNILIVIIIFLAFVLAFIFINKKKNKLESWIFLRNSCLIIGGGMVLFATAVFDLSLVTGGFAVFTLGFAVHSIVLNIKSEQRVRNLERKEIFRKLSMFKEENDANIALVNNLIDKKEKYFPEKLLKKKLSQKQDEKYFYNEEEFKILKKAGVWIPKENFSYDSALHVLEIGQHIEDDFINSIREYIKVGKKLNVHKDFCQQWIIARNGIINPDETLNYYKSLDKAKEITSKTRKMIKREFKKLNFKGDANYA